MKRKILALAMLGLAALVQSRTAQAAVVTFEFDRTSGAGSATTSSPLLSATFTDYEINQVLLTLEANLTNPTDYIRSVGFNVDDTIVAGSNTGLFASAGDYRRFEASGITVGNEFDFGFLFRNSAPQFDSQDKVSVILSRSGTVPFDPLTAISFVDINSNGQFAAVQINSTLLGVRNEVFQAGAPVVSNPEASPLILGGMVSLLGLGYGWKRRQRTAA